MVYVSFFRDKIFKKKAFLTIAAILFMGGFFVVAPQAFAATITSNGTGGGAWNTAGTWAGGVAPLATDAVVIASGDTITTGGNRTSAGITINGILSMASGNILTVNGDVSGNGICATGITGTTIRTISLTGNWSFNGTTSGSRNIGATFTGTNIQTLSGYIQNGGTGNSTLTINKTGGSLTLGNAITVNTFTNTLGTFDPSTYLLTATTPTLTAGTLRVGGATWASNYSVAITEPAAGTIEYYAAGDQTIKDISYSGHLTISGSGIKTWTLGGARTIGGNLTVGSGATLTTAGNQTLGVTGNTSITGSLNLGGTSAKTFTGNVIINSGGIWNEAGVSAFSFAGNLQNDGTFTANTGVHTFTTASKTFSGANEISIPSVTISGTRTNNGTLTVSTALAGASTLTNGAAGVLNIGGASTITGLTAIAIGNTVNYNGAGAQAVKATTYHNIIFSGSGIKTMQGATTINGNITIDSGAILDEAAITMTLSSGSIFTVNGTLDFTSSTGLVRTGNNVNATLVMGSAGLIKTFDDSGIGPGTNASLQNQGTGVWTTTSISLNGTVEFYRNTTSNQIVTDRDYNNLTITGSTRTKTWTLAADRTINGNVTINSGALFTLSGTRTVNIKGNWSNSGTFTPGAGTINFNGAAQNINNANTWYNLFITGTAARTVVFQSGALQTVTNQLTLTGASGQILNLAPSASPTKWQLNAPATQIINYVSSLYSDASSGILINAFGGTGNINGGNNTNWNFYAPNTPSSINQYKADGATAIAQGTEGTNQTQVVFKATATDSDENQYKLEVEVLPSASSYVGAATCSSSFVDSGSEASTGVCGVFTNGASYKWQYRLIDSAGASTAWTAFGGTDPDFVMDDIVPVITQVTPVPAQTNNPASYTFNSSENGSITYGGSCSSETVAAVIGDNAIVFNTLADGTYSDCAIAITDAAGNPSNTLEVNDFTIDALAPSVAITNKPADFINTSSATIEFNVDDVAAILTCKLNGNDFTPCESPVNLSALAETSHNFTVRATDLAGNYGEDSVSFTVDLTPPNLVVNNQTTNNPTPDITGTTDDSADISVTVNGVNGEPFTAAPDELGFWSVNVVNTLLDGIYTIQASSIDAAGNPGTSEGTLTIDTEAPNLIVDVPIPHSNTGNADIGGTTDPSAAISVNIGGNSYPASVLEDGSWSINVGPFGQGSYPVAVIAADELGNTAEEDTELIIDMTPPVITLNGEIEMTINAGEVFEDPGAVAEDAVDGDLTDNIDISDIVDTSTPGIYQITYDVSDAAGNSAETKTRAVTVVDATKPSITLNGDTTINLIIGGAYEELGATANDNVDGDISSKIVISGAVDASVIGTYAIAYNVSDAAGNQAKEAVRTVIVSELDTTAPTVTTLGTGAKDYQLPLLREDPVLFGATLIFSEELSDAGKTAVEDALAAGADKTLTYRWGSDGNNNKLRISVAEEETAIFANDVVADVSDVAGNTAELFLINSLADNQTSPVTADDGSGTATADSTTPEVVIIDPNQSVDITISSGTANPTINVSSLITGGTGTLPKITINSANAGNASVEIPASAVVTSADPLWNGIISAPTITTVTLPETSGQTKTLSMAVEVGFTGAKLSFDKAVRILLSGQAGKKAGYIRTGIDFTEITNICAADDQATGDALAADGDCKIDVGSDLVIWTKHFTAFATYAQASTPAPETPVVSAGGGGMISLGNYTGSAISAPFVPDQGISNANTQNPAITPAQNNIPASNEIMEPNISPVASGEVSAPGESGENEIAVVSKTKAQEGAAEENTLGKEEQPGASTASENLPEESSLLASIITLGTGNYWFMIIFLFLVIGAAYGVYRFSKKTS